jgi:hypothetical protein
MISEEIPVPEPTVAPEPSTPPEEVVASVADAGTGPAA